LQSREEVIKKIMREGIYFLLAFVISYGAHCTGATHCAGAI
jgi:hypothetical protein